MGDHWAETFDGDGVNADNRAAFVAANSKYATMEAAVVGGYNAQKISGKPFKFPESMDKLPSDESRADFTSQARTLLNINIPKDVESLKDVNFKAGIADGLEVDENFVGILKNWAVESGVDTGTLGKMLEFYHGPLLKYAKEVQDTKQEADKLTAKETCNAALVEHFKGEDKVKDLSLLMHRTIVDHMGLSRDERAEVADAMADSILPSNPVMAKGMLNFLSSASKEGTTLSGEGGGSENKGTSPYEAKKARYPKSESMWGDPSDKWESESLESQRLHKPKTEKT